MKKDHFEKIYVSMTTDDNSSQKKLYLTKEKLHCLLGACGGNRKILLNKLSLTDIIDESNLRVFLASGFRPLEIMVRLNQDTRCRDHDWFYPILKRTGIKPDFIISMTDGNKEWFLENLLLLIHDHVNPTTIADKVFGSEDLSNDETARELLVGLINYDLDIANFIAKRFFRKEYWALIAYKDILTENSDNTLEYLESINYLLKEDNQ